MPSPLSGSLCASETLSSDDVPLPTKEQCQSFCSSMPSTSRVEPLLITTVVERSRGSLSPRLSLCSPEKYQNEIRPGSRADEEAKEDEKPEEEDSISQTRTKEKRSYIQEKPTCAWDECTQIFDDVNVLFDHVMEVDIPVFDYRENDLDSYKAGGQ